MAAAVGIDDPYSFEQQSKYKALKSLSCFVSYVRSSLISSPAEKADVEVLKKNIYLF